MQDVICHFLLHFTQRFCKKHIYDTNSQRYFLSLLTNQNKNNHLFLYQNNAAPVLWSDRIISEGIDKTKTSHNTRFCYCRRGCHHSWKLLLLLLRSSSGITANADDGEIHFIILPLNKVLCSPGPEGEAHTSTKDAPDQTIEYFFN